MTTLETYCELLDNSKGLEQKLKEARQDTEIQELLNFLQERNLILESLAGSIDDLWTCSHGYTMHCPPGDIGPEGA